MNKLNVLMFIIVTGILFPGCTATHESLQKKYLKSQGNISLDIRDAIINGKIIEGMHPDEAVAAGGSFTYMLQPDPALGWGDNVCTSYADLTYYFQF